MKEPDPADDGMADLRSFELPMLPPSWCWATARQLAAGDGHSLAIGPFGSNLKVSDYRDSGVPLVFVRNIRSAEFGGNFTKYVSAEKAIELSAHSIEPGDIVVTKMGEPPGDAQVYPYGQPRGIITADCIKFRLRNCLGDPRFFVHAIISKIGRSQIGLITKGVAQQKVSLGRFAQIRLPLAPINEQRRIVEKIEELFSDLDAGVAALERARANLKRYRASVLKAAVEGNLTAEWRAKHPNVEPASKLLECILKERRRKWEADQLAKFAAKGKQPPTNWQAKYVEPIPPDTTNLPDLPQRWCWASVDQLSFVVRGSSPRPAGDPRYFGGPIPWITVGSITADEKPYLRSTSEGLTEAGKEASRWIDPDTLLLTNSGATLGVPKITKIGGCINDGSVALLNIEEQLKMYLLYFLKSQTERLRAINQGAAQPNLNTGIVKTICVPLCSIEEQERVIAEVAEKLSQIESADVVIDHGLLRAARLRQGILKQAFEGKLVPQDPKDDPASNVLNQSRGKEPVESPGSDGRRRIRKATA